MKKLYSVVLCFLPALLFAQPNNNGTLDNVEEFSTKYTVPFTMPDGIKLMTDVYIPVVQDCLMVRYVDTIFGSPVDKPLQIIKKGSQIVIYDTLNGQPNPNPYQLPLVFTRTPYGKGGNEAAGALISMLGFAYAMQDMRGRYTSQGVYLPMLSDSWSKNAYHSDFSHIADITSLSSKYNSNRHEDGYNSITFITDSLKVPFGNPSATGLLCNGSIGGFGASALGNTQYQYAAAHRINPNGPGLKSILPIVATNEHFRYTGYQNGVFRERIVTGWLKGQIFDLDDDQIPNDNDVQNDIHTAKDHNLPNKFQVAFKAIDHFSSKSYNGYLPGYYPNSKGRAEMDASHANVDADGESVSCAKLVNGVPLDVSDGDPAAIRGFGSSVRPGLTYSRYNNSQVSAFHLTGWWDIFTDGQIETFENMRKYCNDSLKRLQKLVIGPWAHQTIGTQKTGDMTYPKNVIDITKFDVEDVDVNNLSINDVLQSELVEWFRYTLNYNGWKNTGDPKFVIPESQDWQPFIDDPLLGYDIRIPSVDYKITFEKLFNYLNGTQGLAGMMVELKHKLSGSTTPLTIDVPASGNPMLPGLNSETVTGVTPPNFKNEWEVPPVRFYVAGPNDSTLGNENRGNYWFSYHKFPMDELVTKKKLFLHNNGTADFNIPTTNEGFATYMDDPDDPVKTVGGANMIVKNPNGDGRDSQGQMNLADPTLAPYTMNRPGVLQFSSATITEANGFPGDSLSVIGFPRALLYAKSNPAGTSSGLTDTDFFVRILDVYPPDNNGISKEYFVVEGCINARAREYAYSIYQGNEDVNAPFSNINIGWVYGYKFKMMPIAYTFGKGHRIKVLISSSNHPRYQANPNIPIEDGEFFRRQPLDGKGYEFNGQLMYPRKAVQRIDISNLHPSHIELPVYSSAYVGAEEEAGKINTSADMLIYPNPASDEIEIYLSANSSFSITITNISGQQVFNEKISDDRLSVDVKKYPPGLYFIEAEDISTGEKKVQKFSVVR